MPRFKKLRKFDSNIFVYEYNPIKNPSLVSFGIEGKFEKLSSIKNTEFEKKGHKEIAKINFGYFGGTSEHNGWVVKDNKIQGSPSANQAECWLDKKGVFHVGKLTDKQALELKDKLMWGGSLSYALLIDGKENFAGFEKYSHFNQKNPRTLIGQKKDGVMVLVVTEGREYKNIGLTGKESAQIMKELGCINAINADGGGSSMMIVDGKLVNEPSDGKERAIGSALVVYEKVAVKEEPKPIPTPKPTPIPMNGKVIVLDAGHGENTWEDTHSKGVPGLEEHHFNADAVKYAKEHLERNGFKVLLSQPLNKKDVPLIDRTNFINSNKVDLVLSFHADASPNADARGHWGFYWYTSANGKKLADIWGKELSKATGTKDRGNQESKPGLWTNFHMVRETKPVAVLMEHAFMTNPEDFKLLITDEFRKQCGLAAAKAVCKYFGIEFK